jgi:hypothetical protein
MKNIINHFCYTVTAAMCVGLTSVKASAQAPQTRFFGSHVSSNTAGAFAVRVNLDVATNNLTVSDFTVFNGTATDLRYLGATGAGQDYALSVVPTIPGRVSVLLPANSYTTASGAGNPVSPLFSTTYIAPPGNALGLLQEVFGTEELKQPLRTLSGGNIDYRWLLLSAAPADLQIYGTYNDHFSLRAQGKVTVPTSGNWRFLVDSDDGVRVYLGGALALDTWNNTGVSYLQATAPLAMTAGQSTDIRVEYREKTVNAELFLYWQKDAGSIALVPTSALSHGSAVVPQQGVAVEYFSDSALQTSATTAVLQNLNVHWGAGSPSPAVPVDQFSARFYGSIVPPTSGEYTLTFQSDDGIRVWVDGMLRIRAFDEDNGTRTTTFTAVAGRPVPLRVEYREGWGSAGIIAYWSGPGVPGSVIPGERWVTSGILAVSPGLAAVQAVLPEVEGSHQHQFLPAGANVQFSLPAVGLPFVRPQSSVDLVRWVGEPGAVISSVPDTSRPGWLRVTVQYPPPGSESRKFYRISFE